MRHDNPVDFYNMNVYVYIRSYLSRPLMTEMLSPIKAQRREKILDAGEHVFRVAGFRGTTMKAIAQTAAMSKVTLYGYFRDKDAVFLAVAERLAQRLETAVLDALNKQGTLTARITAALLAKQDMVQEVVRSSAFSAEIFANSNLIAAKIFTELDAKITARIGEVLALEKIALPYETARLLFAASLGIGEHVPDANEAKADIERLVAAFL
jgi:AcrR family transcriptional regulator